MKRGKEAARRPSDILWLLLSVAVLLVVVFYWRNPGGLGFTLGLEWQVMAEYGLPPDTDQVPRVGDKLLRVGDLTVEEWRGDRTASIMAQVEGRSSVPIELIRDGERMTIDYPITAATRPGSTNIVWYLPFMFWGAGTVTGLLARPRSKQRRLLTLGWFGTAVWLAAGYTAFDQANYSNVVLHLVLWPTVAAQFHAHLLLPWALGRQRVRTATVGLLWTATVLLAALDAARLVPRSVFLMWLVLGFFGAGSLILYRLTRRREPQLQAANRMILVGTALGSSPLVLYALVSLIAPDFHLDLWSNPAYFVAFVALLPIWPLSYLYAVHRHAFGGLAFRANSVIAVWAFGTVLLVGFMAIYLAVRLWFPEPFLPLAPFLGLLVSAGAVYAWRPFQHWINGLIFGIRYDLDQVLETFTQRIPRARKVEALRDVVVRELLPTLMIRESVLYLVEDGEATVFAWFGVAEGDAKLSRRDAESLFESTGRYLRETDSPLPWVRLAIPLRIQDGRRGLWLFGRRDPDDFYPAKDVETLASLGDSVASSLAILALLEKLRRSEAKYRALFEEAKDAIFVSTVGGRFVEINQAGVDLFGYESKDELLAQDIIDRLYEDPDERSRLQRLLEEQGFVKDHEVALRRKDGKRITVIESSSVMRDDKGRVVGYQGILRDLTTHLEMERRLLRSERMEAIGRLAGGVAHDFNNLLTVILGNAELLAQRMEQDEVSRELLRDVSDAGERASSLTRQLLAFGRRQVLQPAILDLREVIRNTVALLRPLIGANIDLVTDLQDKPLLIEADAGQIQQVILNLALNAKDAMPRGGKLLIESREVGTRPAISGLADGGESTEFALCKVVDSGVGIPGEDQEHVFEPFFTSKAAQDGTGLGLATVYGIVKQSGGYITLESEVGRGSAFEIYLPLHRGEAQVDPDCVTATEEASADSGKVVLLVEDQPEVRRLARAILERAEFRILEAPDGIAAIEHFADKIDGVDLLLTDIVMPGMGGPELAKRMTASRSDLKVLFISGYGSETAALGDALAEGHGLLRKPFKPQDLLAAVRGALGDRRSERP